MTVLISLNTRSTVHLFQLDYKFQPMTVKKHFTKSVTTRRLRDSNREMKNTIDKTDM